MTRRLPPDQLKPLGKALPSPPERIAEDFFIGTPGHWQHLALAALYRLRPELGTVCDDELHARHLWLWPRDEHYFVRVCRLLKWFGVGAQWGGE